MQYSDKFKDRKPNILVVLSGSVASIKAEELCSALMNIGDVRVVTSKSAFHFISYDKLNKILQPAPFNHQSSHQFLTAFTHEHRGLYLDEMKNRFKNTSSKRGFDLPPYIYIDEDEWLCWQSREDPVLHIELRRWADILVVAPLSANLLACMAQGLSSDLKSCVCRAWEWGSKPCLIAPAMNTAMYVHTLTAQHLDTLRGLGAEMVPPQVKRLACNDVGIGAMASVEVIAEQVAHTLQTFTPTEPHTDTLMPRLLASRACDTSVTSVSGDSTVNDRTLKFTPQPTSVNCGVTFEWTDASKQQRKLHISCHQVLLQFTLVSIAIFIAWFGLAKGIIMPE